MAAFLFVCVVVGLLLLGSVNGAAHVYLSSVNRQTKTPCVDDEEAAAPPAQRASLRHRPQF